MTGIVFKDVTFSYDREVILENLSLTLEKGKITIIVGPNGAGKSTLLKLSTGLLEPTKGTIAIEKDSIKKWQDRGLIYYIPQIYNKNAGQFPASVKEIVHLGLIGQATKNKVEKDKLVEKALEQVHMLPFINRRIGDLSGGQQQRVMIAQALVRNPSYLFLDEPTSGIDSQTSSEIFSLLENLKNEGMTIIMVTHDVEQAASIADHVICIDRHVCYDGDSKGFLSTHFQTIKAWHVGG